MNFAPTKEIVAFEKEEEIVWVEKKGKIVVLEKFEKEIKERNCCVLYVLSIIWCNKHFCDL